MISFVENKEDVMKTRKSNPKSTKYGVCSCICLIITLLFGTLGRNVVTASEKPEKTIQEHWIAIASNGETLNSPVSHKLKLAKYFVLYDMESNSYKVIKNIYDKKNTFREVLIANMLIAKRISCVICGNCTNRAADILKRGHVFICLHTEENVQKVIDDYRDALGKSRKSSITNLGGN